MKKYIMLFTVVIGVFSFIITGRSVKATEKTSGQVTIVEVPQNLNFYLDPENENGRGQIYSNKYRIRNGGKEAVTFSIEMTLSILDAQASIKFCQEEWNDEPEDRSVYMYALFEGKQVEDKCVLTDLETPCKDSFVLEPSGKDGDTIYISFGGALSHSEDWKSGELAINSVYNMSSGSMGYMVSVEGEHIRIDSDEEKLASGKSAELYLVPDEGYSLPAKIQVFMGDMETEALYDVVTGKILLENVNNDVVIYANGITKAKLPDVEVMNTEEVLWSWIAQEGIQAYEYSFLYEDVAVKNGRVDVNDGSVSWNWSEGLENGEYQLRLKAIGDTVHCLNSEEMNYKITVNQELLRQSEENVNQPSAGSENQGPEQPSDGSENQEPEQPSDGNENQEPEQPSGGIETQDQTLSSDENEIRADIDIKE